MNDKVLIDCLPGATRRTKSKVKEHGPLFEVLTGPRVIQALEFKGRPCVLVLALKTPNGRRTPWMGWLPDDEVILLDEPIDQDP